MENEWNNKDIEEEINKYIEMNDKTQLSRMNGIQQSRKVYSYSYIHQDVRKSQRNNAILHMKRVRKKKKNQKNYRKKEIIKIISEK